MDIIFIRALRVETVIGIHAWERRTRQIVSLDIDMQTDVRRAGASDCIAHALDYSAVAERLVDFISTRQFKLLEALAEACAKLVLDEFGVTWVRLKLDKPGAVAQARSVGVSIERHRDG